MILLIDIGNTNIVLGIYDKNKKIKSWRLETRQTKTDDEYGSQIESILTHENIKTEDIKDVVIASVVPTLQHTFKVLCKKYLNRTPIVVGENTRTGMPIKHDNPREVGADRIANSVALVEHYKLPAILIDMGTAVTFDVVSKNGEYLGGAISPGLGIASEALFERTSKLPRIEVIKPKNAIGKSTVDAMKSGLFYGFIGLIDNVIEQILLELNEDKDNVSIIATGGYSEMITKNSKYLQSNDQDITLEGMRIIYEKTIESRKNEIN